jgi:hypothetical protein
MATSAQWRADVCAAPAVLDVARRLIASQRQSPQTVLLETREAGST